MQVIQSLSDAMSWLEREISWGANPAELRHLMGRIGELYVAMFTNGNLAEHVNEKGYDVVSKDNERISVKTTTRSEGKGHVAFNPNTLCFVDRVIILRFNQEEMELEILLDESVEVDKELMTVQRPDGKLTIPMGKLYKPRRKKVRSDEELAVTKSVVFREYTIRELESGTIEILEDGRKITVVKPVLREIARRISVPMHNSNGNPYNTRQLGTLIIKELNERELSGIEEVEVHEK